MAERRLRLSPNVAAVLVLGVLGAALLLWQRPWGTDTPDQGVVPIPADAATQLTTQLRELSEAGSQDAFVDASGDLPAGRDFGRRTWQSLRAITQPGASLRYVSGGEVADRPDGSSTMTAEVSWRPADASGLDTAVTHRSTVSLRVAPERDGGFSIVGAGPAEGAVPIWLLGDVTVDSDDGRSLIRVDGGDDSEPIDELATAARAAVERTVPGTAGRLTIISPRTQQQMAAILGQDQTAIAQIAAVTTGVDGDSAGADPVVVLNPQVFATMDRRAAQVVVSHEATHALTSAVGTTALNWVVEGFADYVALRDDDAPLTVSAGQALARVRADGAPRALPTDADFGSTQHGLGAVYESAWMIFRMLGEQHPDADVVAFYRAVVSGMPVERALRESLGLSVDELTAQWRSYLTKSASTVS